MADSSPTANALADGSTHLKQAIIELDKACEGVKTGNDATKELEPQISLLYDECRDLYTRLAGLCADAKLAAETG